MTLIFEEKKHPKSQIEELKALVDEIDAAYKKAAKYAKKHGISFAYEGPIRGMGGYFYDKSGWMSSTDECFING